MEVKVGDKFAVRNEYGQGYRGKIVTVDKVYKNGRFIMEHDRHPFTQWSVFSDCIMTSGGFRSVADPLTEEVQAKIIHANNVDRAKMTLSREIERLADLRRSGSDDAILQAAAVIFEGQKP